MSLSTSTALHSPASALHLILLLVCLGALGPVPLAAYWRWGAGVAACCVVLPRVFVFLFLCARGVWVRVRMCVWLFKILNLNRNRRVSLLVLLFVFLVLWCVVGRGFEKTGTRAEVETGTGDCNPIAI